MTVRTSESIAGPYGYHPPPLLEAKNYDSETLECAVKPLSNGAAILSLAGEIDMSTANRLIHCFQLLADQESTGVLIDATEVTFMDSSGLHALIEGKRLMHELDCRIVLVPSPQVRRLLEIVFPEPLFAARVDSIEEGLAVLNSEPADHPAVVVASEVATNAVKHAATRLEVFIITAQESIRIELIDQAIGPRWCYWSPSGR